MIKLLLVIVLTIMGCLVIYGVAKMLKSAYQYEIRVQKMREQMHEHCKSCMGMMEDCRKR